MSSKPYSTTIVSVLRAAVDGVVERPVEDDARRALPAIKWLTSARAQVQFGGARLLSRGQSPCAAPAERR